ncbi:AraC family transcriptional activator of pobA [Dysgonomonadaceae bacterium PH5-43]|nr:AraC family transcriptional activator of pobA [Dysgonomonadaceae bacterium PH5-43]
MYATERNPVIEIILASKGYIIIEGVFNSIRINEKEFHLSIFQGGKVIERSPDFQGWHFRFNPEYINNTLRDEDIVNDIELISSFLYQYPLRLNNKAFDRVSQLFSFIIDLSNGNNSLLIKTYFVAIILEVKKLLGESALDFYPAKAFTIVKRYNDLLCANLDNEHDLSFYAEQLNISPNHLNKCVKTVLGKTSISILNEKRISKAKLLLASTDLTVSEISFQLGFLDQSYFSRFFKRTVGMSPIEYRKQS